MASLRRRAEPLVAVEADKYAGQAKRDNDDSRNQITWQAALLSLVRLQLLAPINVTAFNGCFWPTPTARRIRA
jgi:hypothetical protein